MSVSFVHLRRILFGTSCAVVFGFGATQALASPTQALRAYCTLEEEKQCQNFCGARGMLPRCSHFSHYQCQCVYGPYMPNDP